MTEVQDTEKQESDVVALLRLFEYARLEAERLGLSETARLIDLPVASCLQESRDARGALLLEEKQQPDQRQRRRRH